MKLLLDENLPLDLRHFLAGHVAYTVDFMQWKGLRNGALLAAAAAEGFAALITLDMGIPHQHNPSTLPLAVIVLRSKSTKLVTLQPLVPALLAALDVLEPRSVVVIGE